MAFTVPTAVNRILYNTAKRVRDEVGKGQEVLRTAHANLIVGSGATVREVLLIPDVDIVIVEVKYITHDGDAGDVLELLALANNENFTVGAGTSNRLIAQLTSAGEFTDNAMRTAPLLGLNGNIVQAGQPIIALATEDSSAPMQCYIQISYILADAVLTY